MEAPSQLENFINSQRHEGQILNEGVFTLAREKALEKLAGYQLPFEGAWAVKTIQAAVSGGVEGPIRVDQTSKETRFYFACEREWSLDLIEEAFFQTEQTDLKSINHLVSALWVVGVKDKRAFQITLPWEQECLVWDGTAIHRVEMEASAEVFSLSVSLFPDFQSKIAGWVVEKTKAARHNAEVSQALAERCFTSPRPITVDGRRIDGFQFAPGHGWGETSFPLSLNFCSGKTPDLPIPPGTFERLDPKDEFLTSIKGIRAAGTRALSEAYAGETPTLGVMVSAHAMKATTGKRTTWETTTERSRCFWVLDGVVLQIELLELVRRCCSVALFVNAEGLQTDLSGFNLSVGPEKTARFEAVTREAFEPLLALNTAPFKELIDQASLKSRVVGGVLTLLGISLSFAAFGTGLPLVGAGLVTIKSAGGEERSIVEEYRVALRELVNEWKIQFVPLEKVNTP